MMHTPDDFWNLIGSANEAEETLFIEQFLIGTLANLSDEEIVNFERMLYQFLTDSYRWDVWAAAWVMNGGDCGDDEFDYFRAWLVAQGKEVFEFALENPDNLAECLVNSLVDTADEDIFYSYEELLDVASQAYLRKHGIQPENEEEALENAFPPEIYPQDYEIQGTEWSESDLPKIVPRLCALFKYSPQGV